MLSAAIWAFLHPDTLPMYSRNIRENHLRSIGKDTLKEVAQMLHDACGCKQPLFYVPISLAYRLAEKMEKKAAKTGGKPMMTRFAVYNLDRNNHFDYSKAERELGYHTRPYAETLRDEARWLVAAGKIKGNVHLDETPERGLSGKLLRLMKKRNRAQHVAAAGNA